MPKLKEELPKRKQKVQPGFSLGLSSWQKRKLQRLGAEELKKRNMAWIPKESRKDKNDMQDFLARKTIGIKKEKSEANKKLSRRSKKYL